MPAEPLKTNVGSVRTFTFSLSARRTDGTWGPAQLGVGATVTFLVQDQVGAIMGDAAMTILQDDDTACLVRIKLASDSYSLARAVYRVKIMATRAGETQPESFPPGEDWIALQVGPDPQAV